MTDAEKKYLGKECFKLLKWCMDNGKNLSDSSTTFGYLGTDNMNEDQLLTHYEELKKCKKRIQIQKAVHYQWESLTSFQRGAMVCMGLDEEIELARVTNSTHPDDIDLLNALITVRNYIADCSAVDE